MSDLKAHIQSLASAFAENVLAAIRSASLDDLLAESGGHRVAHGGGEVGNGRSVRRPGRLPRRSAAQIAKTLDRVLALVKKSNGGLRAEEIRKALDLDVREMPRVLKEGLRTKKLRSKGQKRATTYLVR